MKKTIALLLTLMLGLPLTACSNQQKSINGTQNQTAASEIDSEEEQQEDYTTEDDFTYDLRDDGMACITKYTGSDPEVKIPKTIDGNPVVSLRSTFAGNQTVVSVTIPDSVVTIKENTFFNCPNLTEIIIPDSVVSISESAFLKTGWLEQQPEGIVYAGKVAYTYKTDFPEQVTEITLKNGTLGISENAFYGFENLENIDAPDSLISIGASAFGKTLWYSQQVHMDIRAQFDNGQNEKVIYVGKVAYCFASSSRSSTIRLEEGTTGIADSCFSGSSHLDSIEIPGSVKYIGRAAFQATNLRSLTIPESVTSIDGAAFYHCQNLRSITIPGSVTSIGNETFDKCINVTIYGDVGSCAETYAEENNMAFRSIET